MPDNSHDESKSAGRVILTHARSVQALAAARSLHQHGIEVIGGDSAPLMAMSFSRAAIDTFLYPPYETQPEEYIQAINENIRRFKPDSAETPYLLMPVDDDTALLSERRDELDPAVRLVAPALGSMKRVWPKTNLARTAEEFNIPIPETYTIESESDLEDADKKLEGEFLLKAPDANGAKGIALVDEHADPERLYESLIREQAAHKRAAELLAQELVPGTDYCVPVLCWQGRAITSMTYRNVVTFPSERGFGVVRETVDGAPLEKIARRLLEEINWSGVAQVDFRWDPEGNRGPWLIEVNARFWGGLFHCIQSGIDFPYLVYLLASDQELPEIPEPALGTKTRLPFAEFASSLEAVATDEEYFRALQRGWKEGQLLFDQGQYVPALKRFGQSLIDAANPLDRYRRFQEMVKEHDEAIAERLSNDDPLASLGVLYVLGTLVRYGKLPKEIDRHHGV